MTSKHCCPECRQYLGKAASGCSCGWQSPKSSFAPRADHRCQYAIAGKRCPLPGGICSYPYGSGLWYCAGHLQTFDDPRLDEAVLRDAEENYQKIIEKYRDWRRKCI